MKNGNTGGLPIPGEHPFRNLKEYFKDVLEFILKDHKKSCITKMQLFYLTKTKS